MSFEPTNRELCPNETCIGVIGADGRCKECGAVAPSAHTHPRLRGMQPDPDADTVIGPDDERELCPDGACIGLIGDDGRCKECGRTGEGGATRAAQAPAVVPIVSVTAAADAASDDIEQRELCPDGMCIGVIGPDGRCKVCGAAGE